jgi:RNA-directed DNA polymerase
MTESVTTWQAFLLQSEAPGSASALVDALRPYARNLEKQGLPVIVNFDHLAAWVGIAGLEANSIASNPGAHYITHIVPKKNGATRRIDEPSALLKRAQRRILKELLSRIPVHPAANAFVTGKSIRVNASPHRAHPMVLSLDVKDFFGSIRPTLVTDAFSNLGYSRSVCDGLVALTVYRNGLPQGAPTSPALSNLVLRAFDVDLENTMYMVGGTYTRYADDITVSGRFKPGLTIFLCRELLSRYGLELNDAKTRLMYRHQRQEVTGVTVNERLQASRKLRRHLRQQLFYLRKFGANARTSNAEPIDIHRRRLAGLAEFVLSLNPEDRDALQVKAYLGHPPAL